MHDDARYDQHGVAHGFHGVDGQWCPTPDDTRRLLHEILARPVTLDRGPIWFVDEGTVHQLLGRCHLVLEDGTVVGDVERLDGTTPIGYHSLHPLDGGPTTRLVVAPTSCPRMHHGWGVAAQIYSLWEPDDWGIGDLGHVARLADAVARRGAVAVLLSPLHAPAPTLPLESSPYYPSSRRWLHPLLIPVEGAPPASVDARPGAPVRRDEVWTAKIAALRARFLLERTHDEWQRWAAEQGAPLTCFALWNALALRHGANWREWPDQLRRPETALAVAIHDPSLADEIDLQRWLQWSARASLRAVTARRRVAVIADLAVGSSPDGADTWQYQDLVALDVRIGAPPDPFNAAGQGWGLPPFVPTALRAAHYEPFVEMVRAACADVGGLRIDHVMGLFRQYWIPQGFGADRGAYVRMHADELLAIIRLEATRAGAFVVGEDLGTVEPEVRPALQGSGVAGTRVWWFDHDVAAWPTTTLATVTTHDLPTVYAVDRSLDGTDEMRSALAELAPDGDAAARTVAVHAAIGASRSAIAMATVDDLCGSVTRPNHPGTVGPHNWTVRLGRTAEEMLSGEPGRRIVAALADTRAGQADQ